VFTVFGIFGQYGYHTVACLAKENHGKAGDATSVHQMELSTLIEHFTPVFDDNL